jgi:protein TorT
MEMFIRSLIVVSFSVTAHLLPIGATADTWYPAPVYEWKPAFNTESAREKTDYIPISGQAQKKWRICASIPHLKDAYWLAVNYGMMEEAEVRDVSLSLFEAGGYDRLDVQISQIEKCLSDGMDALIVSSVTLDGTNDVLSRVHAENIPIIDLINGTSFPHISARSAADYYDNGYAAGRYLVDRNKDNNFDITVLWFPGPKTAGWAMRGDLGFKEAIAETNVKLLTTKYGDPVKKIQGELVNEAMKEYPDIDYIVGSTVTAEAATSIVRRKRIKDRTNVMAYYFGPGVHRGILRGSIIAAPTDKQAIQARIAVDQAIRILEDKPLQKHVGPIVEVVDSSNLDSFDLTTSLAPRGFKAIFDVN